MKCYGCKLCEREERKRLTRERLEFLMAPSYDELAKKALEDYRCGVVNVFVKKTTDDSTPA